MKTNNTPIDRVGTPSDAEFENIAADADPGLADRLKLCGVKPLGDSGSEPPRRRRPKWFHAVWVIWIFLLGGPAAFGATSSWSAGLNRIYVEGGGSVTLSDIKAALPTAPLDLVDVPNKIWLLRADMLVRDGSTLLLRGTAAGGDVNELRLQSVNSVVPCSCVISITADWGTLDINSTKITSWDTTMGAPDTNHLSNGRAFVRVLSSLSTNGVTAFESRMNITNSEICYLGSDSSEGYGLVWKVAGTHPNPTNSIFDFVNVLGNVVNSHLHDNYIGAYTYGAFGMQWLTNNIHHNVQYGMSLQEDSDNLVIRGNNVHHNGNHGLLASDGSGQLNIVGNLCAANAKSGMLLEQASDDSLVEGNQCQDNGESGIAVAASAENTIRNNSLMRNARAGLRLSLGSADNVIQNNQSVSNTLYGFHSEIGSGTPLPGDDGRPKRNLFVGNLVQGNGSDPIRITDSDANTFATNSFTDLSGKLRFQRGLGNWLDGNSLADTLILRTEGETNVSASTFVRNQAFVKIELSPTNTATIFADAQGRIHQPEEAALVTEISTNGSSLSLTPAGIGGSTTVTARNLRGSAAPGTAFLHHLVWTPPAHVDWSVNAGAIDQSLSFTLGGLNPNSPYLIRKGALTLTNLTTDATGQLQFADTATTTNPVVYAVEINVRYDITQNRIYVEGGTATTLSDLKAALPTAPLDLVDPTNKIWLVRADFQLSDGSVLRLHGDSAGGDVNELRLLSLNTGATNSVVSITADWGTLDINGTKVTSWDTAVAGPDTNHVAFGRAYVRVRSSLAGGVTPHESRMDITNSEICFLGTDASEAYGLVWKVAGTHPNPTNSIFDFVNVQGNVVNSHLHDNYIGAYTYGAFGMQWLTNDIHHNVQYGLSLQQDSDNLLIRGNNVHHNGNHGLLASDGSGQLNIVGNLCATNAKNGMLLEQSVGASVVEGNQCLDNGESGIAVVASAGNTIRNNWLLRNARAGLRLGLGSADNVIQNNQSVSNTLYGFHGEIGNGTPLPGDDGRPKRNLFVGNLVQGNGSDPIRITDSDFNTFATNSFTDLSGKLRFQRGLGNWLDGNSLVDTLIVRTEGDTNATASTFVRHQAYLKVELGTTNNSTIIADAQGQIHQPDEAALVTEISTNGSSLNLTTAGIGGSTTVTARNLWGSAAPGTAFLHHLLWAPAAHTEWSVNAGAVGQSLSFTMGDLTPNTSYLVRKSTVAFTNVQSDALGKIQFADTATTTNSVVYSVEISYRWDVALNRIYIESGAVAMLSDLKAVLPTAPLDLVDPTNKIWLLRADLQISGGGVLQLHGNSAGGDVNELRLLSLNTGATNSVVSITADWGTLDINGTKVTSWDTPVAGPDTNHTLFGRAYIRVRSSLAADGVTPHESRMDVTNSEICFLGTDASEAYGLVWKVAGTHPNPTNSIFDFVNVQGNVVNSHLHDNYIGAYTYGAFGMQWLTNDIHHNVQYGLSLQQDSDNLLIRGNNVHHNGNHGLLASDGSGQLNIVGNLCATNAKNGMLLEQSVGASVVEGNQCLDNGESGIAVVASAGNTIRNNWLLRNARAGLRLGLGSADNVIQNNQSVSNTLYGFHSEVGNGTPLPGDDGRPKRNLFVGNLVQENGADPIRITDSDFNTFATNSFADLSGKLRFQRGLGNWLDGNSLAATLIVRTEGDTNASGSTFVRNQAFVSVELGTNGSTVFQDADGRMYQPIESPILTEVSSNGTTMPLTMEGIGSSTTVTARNFWVAATPGTAYLSHLLWTNGAVRQWWANAGFAGQTLSFTVRDLPAASAYLVRKSGVAYTNVQADASGQVQFSDNTTITNTVVYSLDLPGTNNTPPSLPLQANRTIGELTSLTVTNTGVDAETPGEFLTYAFLSAPSNAVISANGIITWTPTEAQGSSTNTFSTVVTDNGSPSLNAVNTFTVVVTEVNNAPTLPVQTNRTIAELTQLVVNNTATDPDLPANGLVYSLLSAPANANISTAGVITWTPTESQGPSTNTFTTVVTDDGVPPLSATNSFTVIVNQPLNPNLPPGGNFDLTHWKLTLPDANATVIQSAQLMAGFTDPDYFFTATNDGAMSFWAPVTGGTTSGSEFPRSELREVIVPDDDAVNWTGQGTHRLNALCRVTQIPSSGRVIIGQIHSFSVGMFPLMALQFDTDQVVAKVKNSPNATNETRYAFGNIGLNQLITYELAFVDGLLSMTVNGSNHTVNVFQSDPEWANQTYYFKAGSYCLDNDGPANEGAAVSFYQLSAEHNFPANTAPALPIQPDVTVAELTELVVTNSATDTDVPANSLVYTLQTAPIGAVISTAGVITWTPTEADGPGTNVFTTVVTDNGTPSLRATNFLTVVISEINATPVLAQQTTLTVPAGTALIVTNTASDADLPANHLTYQLTAAPATAAIDTNGVITWSAPLNQGPSTNTFTTVATDDGVPPASATNSFLVVVTVTNTAPVLPIQPDVTVAELTELVVTNSATDTDVPANSLVYTLQTAPIGAVISTAGVITWTPTEADGPGTNVFTTVVTDNGTPSLSATNFLTVVISEINATPVLAQQTTLTVPAGTALIVTNTASDADLPANHLTYQLTAAPATAAIDTNGVITWSAPLNQGPSTNTFTTVATDDGVPPASATNSFLVVVTVTNTAPVLPIQPDRTVAELTELVVTNSATDTDVPANSLVYTLQTAPIGAVISTAGVITWTPTEADGPGTNVFTTVVTDNGTPPLRATNFLTVVVTDVNSAPTLPVQASVTITELTTLLVTNSATDTDLPINHLSYALQSGPSNAVLSANGLITWTPDETQGPSTNTFITVVTDDGVPPLSATNSLTVVVTEINSAPTLPVQANVIISELTTLLVTNTATDPDLPANQLAYSLIASPAGAGINASGIISWTAPGQGSSTNTFTAVVTDDGVPPLSATNTFLVIVSQPIPVALKIHLTPAQGLLLSWAATAPGTWVLQSAESLADAAFSDVNGGTGTLVGGEYQIVIESLPEQLFFRLRRSGN